MTTSEKTGTSLLNPKNTPNCLREADAWMGTRLKKKPNGRIDKPPWRVRRGEKTMPGSKTNREHWASFSEALTALQNGEVAAIGRVFTGDDPFTVIDLDKCRNPETGDITPWALEIVQDMPTYWEVSLSGTGLHGVARAKKNTNHCNRSGVEVYDGNPGSKFMVLTGQHLEGTPTEVRECQTEMDELVRKTFPPDQPKGETRRTPTEPVGLADTELLQKARNARNGSAFNRLFEAGDISGYASHSDADFALCQMLAFWTAWDAERIDTLFRQSALYRDKWERDSYRKPTIRNAIAATTQAYRQKPTKDPDTAAALETLRALAESDPWEGRSGPTDRHVYEALLELAAKHGNLRKNGIIVGADNRTLALAAGTSRNTVCKSLRRLKEDRSLIRRVREGKGTQGSLYRLELPPKNGFTQGLSIQPSVLMNGQPLSKLRNPAPVWEKEYDKNGRKLSVSHTFLLQRVGKLAALVIERAAAGGTTVHDLADKLRRRSDNIRRKVRQLLEAGLLVEDDGRLRIPDDFERRLQVELEESGCVSAEERDRKKFDRHRTGYRYHLENPPDEAPTQEEMDARRRERVERVMSVFCDDCSGPRAILDSYIDGETAAFEGVIRSVAHYFGDGPNWANWRKPVCDAYSLFVGETIKERHGLKTESRNKGHKGSPDPSERVNKALEAMRHGNGPRKAVEDVLAGTQKLPDLAKSIMGYYGAKRGGSWEEWLEPATEALDILTAKTQ